MFDCVRVLFPVVSNKELFYNKQITFVSNYFDIIKSIISDIKTSHFWMVASFLDTSNFDFNFIPEQFEKEQLHCWYNNENKEGNILLIPKQQFIEKMNCIEKLRDFKNINYHYTNDIKITELKKIYFNLGDPVESYNQESKNFYSYMINKELFEVELPNYFPSFWEEEKLYTFGKTNDIMLIPNKKSIKQFYDYTKKVNLPYEYEIKQMDVIFISYDEPSAVDRFKKLKSKIPRAKWIKNVEGQTEAYHAAAIASDTPYFFAVFPKLEILDTFDFEFQPDRLKNPCHYIFNALNPINGLEYGHGAIILYNKKLTLETKNPGLDFTLSASHTHVPILSAINYFNETPWLCWRTSFREVLKLKEINNKKPTVESRYRLTKWLNDGKGKNAEWCLNGAHDADQYYEENKQYQDKLKLSYDFSWLKEFYERKYVRN